MTNLILDAQLYKPLYAFNLDLQIKLAEASNSLAIIGPSGSGKSMALRMISGLVKPSKGVVKLKGNCIYNSQKGINVAPRKRKIGYVFQNYALFPHMTVAQNIMFGMPRMSTEERDKKCEELIQEIRLTQYANRFPSQLSGGQQQRVALARALAAEPKLLLLDEPFSALDVELRGELEGLLLEVKETRRIPYILVTHNLEEAFRLCDHLAIIGNGSILQVGPKEEMLKRPRNIEVAKQLGAKNLWTAVLEKREGKGGEVFVPLLNKKLWINELPKDSERFWIGIRPSELELISEPEPECKNTLSIMIINIIRGVKSHTIVVTPYIETQDSMETEIIVEAPIINNTLKDLMLYLPPDKLFAIPME